LVGCSLFFVLLILFYEVNLLQLKPQSGLILIVTCATGARISRLNDNHGGVELTFIQLRRGCFSMLTLYLGLQPHCRELKPEKA